MITLILGGTRSGKSALAERIVGAGAAPVTYLATATVDPDDADFAARIDAHRSRRPAAWTTIEVGADLASVLESVDGTVLVDSLGTWVAGHHDFAVDAIALVGALARRRGDTVVVSEEVGLGVHPSTELGRRFQDALGTVNQTVAGQADEVLLVVAGRALRLERFEDVAAGPAPPNP